MSNQAIRAVSILIVALGLIGLLFASLDIRSFYYGVKYSGFQRTDIIYFMKNSLVFIGIPLLLVVSGIGLFFLKKWAYILLHLVSVLYFLWGIYFIFELINFLSGIGKYQLDTGVNWIELIKRISFAIGIFFIFIVIPISIIIFFNQKNIRQKFLKKVGKQ